MALPTSTNNVTVRKLSSTLQGIWNKITTALGGKTDKVSGATNNNFAGLDSNGNLKDSGKKASDFATASQGSKADSAIQGVKVNGSALTPDTNKVVDVTKSGLGLGNVTNDAQVKRSEMGVANGVATLDSTGKIPTSQIPGSYDDVKEGYLYNGKFYTDSAHTTEIPAAADKVYVDIPTNKTYRWSGTQYVVIGTDLALGETSSTAYRGDRGKAAYDHISRTDNPHSVTKSQVGLGNVDNTSDATKKANFTGAVEAGNTGFATGGDVAEAIGDAEARLGLLIDGEVQARIEADNGKVDKVSGKGLSTNDYTTNEKNKLAGIAANAEVNQNAFSNIKVGSATIAADSKTDTLEIVGSGATTVTPDATNDKLTISSTDQSVTAVGNHYAPVEDSSAEKDASGGSATQLPSSSTGALVQVVTGIKMDAKGHVVGVASKGLWSPDNNTTYTNPKLGHGYASSTAGTSPAFTAAISNYTLNGGNGGFIAIKFSADVPANATLNVQSTGAKSIYWKNAAITAGVIQSGDTAILTYDGTRYQLLGVDRSVQEMTDQEVTDLINALT